MSEGGENQDEMEAGEARIEPASRTDLSELVDTLNKNASARIFLLHFSPQMRKE